MPRVHYQSTVPANGVYFPENDWLDVSRWHSVGYGLKTDGQGTIYTEFSPDKQNIDSDIPHIVAGDIREPHILKRLNSFCRFRFVYTGAAPSVFRMEVFNDDFSQLTSGLKSVIQSDADASISRSISEEIAIAAGLYQDLSIVNKFGLNPDVDSSGNEDIWGGNGFYNGFPSTGEPLRMVSTSANDSSAGTGARTVRVQAMDTNYNWLPVTFTLNGTTPVAPDAPYTTTDFIRSHTGTTITAGSGGVNAGVITCYQATTTTNIFLNMVVGRNQTNASAYTVPAGYTAYMRHLTAACGTATNVSVEGNIWTRSFNGVFRSRRPFFIADNFRLDSPIYGGLVFTEKSDIIIRITMCSANNTPYKLIL